MSLESTDHSLKNNSRIENKALKNAISGALNYLKATQFCPSKKYFISSGNFNVKDDKDLFSKILSKTRSYFGNYIITQKHISGSWPSFVSFLQESGLKRIQPFFVALDYNHFTTVSTAYSLFLFDEGTLPEDKKFIGKMLENALDGSNKFKNGSEYNFWISNYNKEFKYNYIAPINIPLWIVNFRKSVNKLAQTLGFNSFHESEIIQQWVDKVYDTRENKYGSNAIFNIPNDADDTSLALALQIKFQKECSNKEAFISAENFKVFSNYRDLDRKKTDSHNKHLPKNTGAFLTWFKDENLNVFSSPGDGVLPLGVNNIDLVVNCNVLFALASAGIQTLAGFKESLELVSTVITENIWNKSCLYYPESLWFPYAFSRAVRDGGLQAPCIDSTLPLLLRQLLENNFHGRDAENPEIIKSNDKKILATALKLTALLNIGEKYAEIIGLKKEFSETIDSSVEHLLNHMKVTDRSGEFKKRDNFKNFQIFWKSDVLFSSSVQQLAYWYSDALTTSLVLESLTKYALEYESNLILKEPKQLKLVIENNQLSVAL